MIDLQALIMFLVFEKEVLSMADDVKELDLYFLEKHSRRINKELHSFKKKMNMDYGRSVFEIKNNNQTLFIYAHSIRHAMFIAGRHEINYLEIKEIADNQLMTFKETDIPLSKLVEGKKSGVIGGYEVTNYESLRPRKQNRNN